MTVIILIILFVALSTLSTFSDAAMTTESRQTVTDRHNIYRSGLALGYGLNSDYTTYLPKGKNYYKLKYDLSLESVAQNWANQCAFQHSSSPYGENLYKSTANMDPKAAVYDASYRWWKEFNDFGLNPNLNLTRQEFDKGIGHFTQMAWGKTTKIGCGHQWCVTSTGSFTFVVCNYDPPGNYINQFVYQAGNPCQVASDCTTYASSTCSASEGLCVAP
ncbi:cysteine-rich secretory protein family domain-containing protein [Ditylenchus destructor]|uniref:Cysteine-rich secretory protein family domain-containing protein n=1 Tax=Ditylenchus destructor TaxID=166010 RepID=A0AAD4MXN5_9BILA|nr:cysteine-rich secretory protein family domain-containing protein [Ditylenchus destructor]